MKTLPQSEMLAVLLNLMGTDAAKTALEEVPADTSRQVTATLEEFKQHPPTQSEVEYVIDDFVKYFRFAMKTVEEHQEEASQASPDGSSESRPDVQILQLAEESFEVETEPVRKFLPPKLTGDPAHDLNRMHPYQVASGIRTENPTTISLVIRSLATEHAAKTLELLPDAVRPAVFLQLAQPSNVSDVILDKILATSLDIAMRVEQREAVADAADQMVSLIRSVPKSMRAPMLAELQKTDEDLCAQVKSKMYQFDDLGRLSDRDLQQVLGQTSTDALVLALQGAEEELTDRVLGNMSKRARESLQEEMGFKTDAKQEEIDTGRNDVVKVLVELDEAGTISLE